MSYFPIKVFYVGSKEVVVVQQPGDLRNRESFKVLETRVKLETNRNPSKV